ncbi:MAG: integrin alpha, partial [Chthoniobacteraceae bacterium]
MIIGAEDAGPGAAGVSYVVFGSNAGFSASVDLAGLDGSNGFKIGGVAAEDYAGTSVSAAGDLNGDGVDDLIIGASDADANGTNSGASYVVFGRNTAVNGNFAAAVNLSQLDGRNGFRISGIAPFDGAGSAVSAAGDINGDGIDDVIIGAYEADPNGMDSGEAYVLFGRNTALSGNFPADLNLADLDGINGFRISGAGNMDGFGYSARAAGDINGDGFGDIIIGAPAAASNTGAAFVIFGMNTGATGNFPAQFDLSSLDGSNGFKISGATSGDYFGTAVSAAGDINGDGIDDVIIGATLAAANGAGSGASYVVFGQDTSARGNFAANLLLSSLDGSNGFRIKGAAAGDYSGISVSGAGDFNGDGVDDLIVGAFGGGANGDYSGAAYVVYGRNTALAGDFSANLNLNNLGVLNGIRLNGAAAGDGFGISVSAAGDFNGDGISDLIVGAAGVDANGVDSGASYVLFGFQFIPEGVVIKAGGNLAKFVDADGDRVTVKSSKGALSSDNFVFTAGGLLSAINLAPLSAGGGGGDFQGAKISISTKSSGGSDGMINVGVINGLGVSLKSLKVAGDIGAVILGESVPGKMALTSLKADSIGLG